MSTGGRGRARSETSRRAILDATLTLVSEQGYAALSIERIAARAGVGKQTIYRWWPSKSDVLAECVLDGIGLDGTALDIGSYPVPVTSDARTDLAGWFGTVEQMLATSAGIVVRALAAAAAENENVRTALYEKLTGPAQHVVSGRLAASAVPNSDMLAESLVAGLLYRLLTRTESEPLDLADFVALVPD